MPCRGESRALAGLHLPLYHQRAADAGADGHQPLILHSGPSELDYRTLMSTDVLQVSICLAEASPERWQAFTCPCTTSEQQMLIESCHLDLGPLHFGLPR